VARPARKSEFWRAVRDRVSLRARFGPVVGTNLIQHTTPKKKTMTLLELWKNACKDLIIRHPDPEVKPVLTWQDNCDFSGCDCQQGRAAMYITFDVKDTRDQLLILKDFRVPASFDCWPGAVLARELVLCVWLAYITHETMELVTMRSPPPTLHSVWDGYHINSRVVCPHTAMDTRVYCVINRSTTLGYLSMLYPDDVAKSKLDKAVLDHASEYSKPTPESPWVREYMVDEVKRYMVDEVKR